jgi:hypothetical protein
VLSYSISNSVEPELKLVLIMVMAWAVAELPEPLMRVFEKVTIRKSEKIKSVILFIVNLTNRKIIMSTEYFILDIWKFKIIFLFLQQI